MQLAQCVTCQSMTCANYPDCIEQSGKDDFGKPHPTHCPPQIIHDILEVRQFGNKKYHDPESWRTVHIDRYVDAMLRHALAVWDNPNAVDEESGLAHYKHMACNLAFICALKSKEAEK